MSADMFRSPSFIGWGNGISGESEGKAQMTTAGAYRTEARPDIRISQLYWRECFRSGRDVRKACINCCLSQALAGSLSALACQ
jgi:hypothetical protein